ncbi:hypothetical protein ScPMuIL_004685 [Solemya velum]
MVFSNLFCGWNTSMLVIYIKLVLLVMVLIAPPDASGASYPKTCNAEYTKCLRGVESSSLECGTERVVCLLKYCTQHMKATGKHLEHNKTQIKKSIVKCLLKYPVNSLLQMTVMD